jgi:hypothetical protein
MEQARGYGGSCRITTSKSKSANIAKSLDKSLIKSKDRVRELGEVFTPDHIVERMLDLFPEEAWSSDKYWLEPTCGNGQFVLGVLRRKLAHGHNILDALNTVVGVDIMSDNITECHERIYSEIVMPYIKQHNINGDEWKALRVEVVCLVENNIRPTKDSLKEDFNKWPKFSSRSEKIQNRIRGRIRKVFDAIDNDTQPKPLNNINKRLHQELILFRSKKDSPSE